MRSVSDQEISEHLRRLNVWWAQPHVVEPTIAKMRPRDYLPAVAELLTNLSVRRAVVLLGPRRVGKTILIQHLVQQLLQSGVPPRRIGYVAVDHPLLHGHTLESLAKLMEPPPSGNAAVPTYLFFDEVQYLKNWEQHLKALVDARPDLRILVSGSAAAALQRQSRESGAGRFTDFLLPPLTFSEYIRLGEHDNVITEAGEGLYRIADVNRLNDVFADYVNFGGYPELALSPHLRAAPERFVKSDIVDKVLLRDLPSLYGIEDIQELNYLFTTLAYNTAEEVSLEALSQKSGVGKPTIVRYMEYLEAVFLVRRIFRVDQSGKRFQRDRAFKVYLSNPAMRTGLYGTAAPDDEGFGHLVETALFAQRFHENASLHYARWGEAEVDMIEMGANFTAIAVTEVKWSDLVIEDHRKLAGVRRFCEANRVPNAIVTTRTRMAHGALGEVKVLFAPAALVCFHLGLRAIKGRIATLAVQESLQPDLFAQG